MEPRALLTLSNAQVAIEAVAIVAFALSGLIEAARKEAEALASENAKALAESLERRSKLAEEKIARAEAQALSEVRSAAVETAMAAAEKILSSRVAGQTGDNLIAQAIKDLKGKLN